MGVSEFLDYIERDCPQALHQVDLGQLARKRLTGPGRRGRVLVGQDPLYLVVDAESCLHRLYGGSFTDWVCGGQWNNMFHFVDNLSRTCRSNNIKLIVFFNGSLERSRINDWIKFQTMARNTSLQVLHHVHNKGTPPPKVLFTPPVCLDSCIRLALRQCGITTACSFRDHAREVIAYLRQYGCHGILAQSSEFAIFDPPLLFSSHLMKLTKKGELLSVQYNMDEVAKAVDLNPERMVIFAALLGNHILSSEDLALFHWNLLGPDHPLNGLRMRAQHVVLPPLDAIIDVIAAYVRNVRDYRDLHAIALDVFKQSQSRTEEKIKRFKTSVEYYWYGSKEAWTRPRGKGFKFSFHTSGSNHVGQQQGDSQDAPQIVVTPEQQTQAQKLEEDLAKTMSDLALEKVREQGYASTEGQQGESSETATGSTTQDPQPGELTPPRRPSQSEVSTPSSQTSSIPSLMEQPVPPCLLVSTPPRPSVRPDVLRISKHRHESGLMMSQVHQVLAEVSSTPPRPSVRPDVLRISKHRHESGLMMSQVHQVLAEKSFSDSSLPLVLRAPEELFEALLEISNVKAWGEVKFGVTLEDEMSGEFPPSVLLFRPIRQRVYSILFSTQHREPVRKEGAENGASFERHKVVIKEWSIRRENTIQKPDLVEDIPLEWKVPQIERLWLGRDPEDKTMRLRAFLSCMYSDSPAMLKTAYVPRHAIILCCVLRYMLHFTPPILRRHELDAFLAQSVSPILNQPRILMDLKVHNITPRGVQLAAIFMRGVEVALFANDACGAPIPWDLCCPWLFFDGKLFQSKLTKAMTGSNLRDMCDGKMDQVGKVDRMKQCILDGMHPNFARPVVMGPTMGPMPFQHGPHPPPEFFYNYHPAGAPLPPMPQYHMGSRGRGMMQAKRPVSARGGRLEVAGVVVGEWAGADGSRGRGGMYSVSGSGGMRGGRGGGRGIGRGYGNGAAGGGPSIGRGYGNGASGSGLGRGYGNGATGGAPGSYGGQSIARRPKKQKGKKQKRKDKGGAGDGHGRGRGLTIEQEEPTPGMQMKEETTSSSEEDDSDLSSSDEGAPSAAFSDAKESLSPTQGGGGDFQLASTDFTTQHEQPISSYHEGGYELPTQHTRVNGGMEHHVTSSDTGGIKTEYGKTP